MIVQGRPEQDRTAFWWKCSRCDVLIATAALTRIVGISPPDRCPFCRTKHGWEPVTVQPGELLPPRNPSATSRTGA